MIFITQLIYLKAGAEKTFDEFEMVAIPLIARYHGKLMFRLRPGPETVIAANDLVPYEVHLVRFETEEDFSAFMQDESRKKFLHLKEASIQSSILIRGEKL